MNASSAGVGRRPPRVYAGLVFLVGAILAIGGLWLAVLGGSPYYVVAGSAIVASAVALWRGRKAGAWMYLLTVVTTAVWAIWEVGLDPWQLLPRLGFFLILGLWLLTPWARRGLQ